MHRLWHEFEAAGTPEARFARALDYLEVQVQHNLADLSTWEPVEHGLLFSKTGSQSQHDGFLRAFAEAVVAAGEAKLAAGGIDVAAVKARLAASR